MARARRGDTVVESEALEVHIDRTAPVALELMPNGFAPTDWDGTLVVRFSEPIVSLPGSAAVIGDRGESLPAMALLATDGLSLEIRLADSSPPTETITVALPELWDRALNRLAPVEWTSRLPPLAVALSVPPGSTLYVNGPILLEAQVDGGEAEEVTLLVDGN